MPRLTQMKPDGTATRNATEDWHLELSRLRELIDIGKQVVPREESQAMPTWDELQFYLREFTGVYIHYATSFCSASFETLQRVASTWMMFTWHHALCLRVLYSRDLKRYENEDFKEAVWLVDGGVFREEAEEHTHLHVRQLILITLMNGLRPWEFADDYQAELERVVAMDNSW